jgi:two-component system phosphate regulon response regulator PhoB
MAERSESGSYRVLLVDDEAELAAALEWSLRRDGFEVEVLHSGRAALQRLNAGHSLPDIVLLDLMLPDIAGTEVCRRLRAGPATARLPVVMLTARVEEIDRVVGFEVGADDYVTKPFSNRELALRLRAVLRRGASAPPAGEAGRFGLLRVDTAAHRAWVDEVEVVLTALEFRLLLLFMERRGRVQSREQLLEAAWGSDTSVTERTVDTQVKRLRQKLGGAGDYIETVRGVGYRFRDRPDEER